MCICLFPFRFLGWDAKHEANKMQEEAREIRQIEYIIGLWRRKKKQLVGKRTMPETRCTELPALTVDSMVGISRSMFDYFSYL